MGIPGPDAVAGLVTSRTLKTMLTLGIVVDQTCVLAPYTPPEASPAVNHMFVVRALVDAACAHLQ